MIKAGLFLLCVLCVLQAGAAAAQVPSPTVTDTIVAGCQRLVHEFENCLKGGLSTAMEEGGPAFAVGVCEITAPAAAARFSELEGWAIRRTARRIRNPLNAPDAFEAAALGTLASDSIAVYHAWTTDTTGQRRFRYLSAIYHGPRCVGCHGDPKKLSGAIQAALTELYPLDQAVGFKPGELRGAYSVTIDWPLGRPVADSLWKAVGADTDQED